jgi:hypothetical protein
VKTVPLLDTELLCQFICDIVDDAVDVAFDGIGDILFDAAQKRAE